MLEQQAAEPSVYTALQKEVIRAGVAKDSDKVGELPDPTARRSQRSRASRWTGSFVCTLNGSE